MEFPRPLFAGSRQRPALKPTGVSVLWGPSESGQLPRVSVGDGDGVLSRLEQAEVLSEMWATG